MDILQIDTEDFDEIYPNLWMGSFHTGKVVAKNNFDVVVFCAAELQPESHLYDPAKCLYCPFDDIPGVMPEPRQIKKIFDTAAKISEAVLAGKKVLVTCMAGLNRSGLVTALSLNNLTGWSGDLCIREIRQKRKTVTLPLYNNAFVKLLMSIR